MSCEGRTEQRCTTYASRAAAPPYDEQEETHRAVWSAFMTSFREVVEAVEAADNKDVTWLTTALAVRRRALGAGVVGLGHALDSVSWLHPPATRDQAHPAGGRPYRSGARVRLTRVSSAEPGP